MCPAYLAKNCCMRIALGEQQGFWEDTKGQTSWWPVDASGRMDNTRDHLLQASLSTGTGRCNRLGQCQSSSVLASCAHFHALRIPRPVDHYSTSPSPLSPSQVQENNVL